MASLRPRSPRLPQRLRDAGDDADADARVPRGRRRPLAESSDARLFDVARRRAAGSGSGGLRRGGGVLLRQLPSLEERGGVSAARRDRSSARRHRGVLPHTRAVDALLPVVALRPAQQRVADSLTSRLSAPLPAEGQYGPEVALVSLAARIYNRFCPHCQKDVLAESSTRLWRAPRYLILQLSRFEYVSNAQLGAEFDFDSRKRKIATKVEFPLTDLDVTELVHPDARKEGETFLYDLVAVCNHMGNVDYGHYIAFCRDDNDGEPKWFEYDDERVTLMRPEDVITEGAYMLIYQRKNVGNISSQEVAELAKKIMEESENTECPVCCTSFSFFTYTLFMDINLGEL